MDCDVRNLSNLISKCLDHLRNDLQLEELYFSFLDFDIFTQLWSNTTGPLEGIGGSAITEAWTMVFTNEFTSTMYIYFSTGYGYTVEKPSIEFTELVIKRQVPGIKTYIKNKSIYDFMEK